MHSSVLHQALGKPADTFAVCGRLGACRCACAPLQCFCGNRVWHATGHAASPAPNQCHHFMYHQHLTYQHPARSMPTVNLDPATRKAAPVSPVPIPSLGTPLRAIYDERQRVADARKVGHMRPDLLATVPCSFALSGFVSHLNSLCTLTADHTAVLYKVFHFGLLMHTRQQGGQQWGRMRMLCPLRHAPSWRHCWPSTGVHLSELRKNWWFYAADRVAECVVQMCMHMAAAVCMLIGPSYVRSRMHCRACLFKLPA